MPDYRLYFFNEEGHIAHVIELDCPDDDAATQLVEQHRDGRPMSLWQRARLVGTFDGRDGAKAWPGRRFET